MAVNVDVKTINYKCSRCKHIVYTISTEEYFQLSETELEDILEIKYNEHDSICKY